MLTKILKKNGKPHLHIGSFLISSCHFHIYWDTLHLFRINIAIELIKESSKAISGIISSLFFPVIPFLLQLLGNFQQQKKSGGVIAIR